MRWISKWLGKKTNTTRDTEAQEAQEARVNAEKRLREAHDQTFVVDDAVRRARELRRTNNWGPRIKKALSTD